MAQSAGGLVLMLLFIGVLALMIASMWKVFTKAGRPGWASIIPIYNTYVMLKIGDNPGWYLVLLLIPLVNLYAAAKMYVGLAKAFGKGVGWGVGLWFLPIVFFPLLAFGDHTYRGSQGGAGGRAAV